uniref:Uncharacterized protein n=1 Tax=Arion vulgaris TaxID=1028688 RepID=A0A0B6Z8N8_9EUPU
MKAVLKIKQLTADSDDVYTERSVHCAEKSGLGFLTSRHGRVVAEHVPYMQLLDIFYKLCRILEFFFLLK